MPEHRNAGEGASSEARRRAFRDDARERSPDEISALRVVNVFLRHRRTVVAIPVAAAFLAVLVALVLPRSYRSIASLTPQADEAQLSELAGIASQFGIPLPMTSTAESPQFYAELLRTRTLLSETAATRYSFLPDGAERPIEGDLLEILGIDAETRDAALELAVEELEEDLVGVSTDPETGVVEFSVTTRWADLSHQVAVRMLELVNRFNVETRNSQAAAEREFTEGQLSEAETALRVAEDSLEAFLQRNRRYENSPELRFQLERLQRRVDLRQQVYTSLAQSYEQARIDAVRDVPVITVVERPSRPAQPEPRGLVWKALLGLFLGGVVAVSWAFGREILAASRETDPDDYAEFARLKREASEDLRRLWRRARRPFGGEPAARGPGASRGQDEIR